MHKRMHFRKNIKRDKIFCWEKIIKKNLPIVSFSEMHPFMHPWNSASNHLIEAIW